MLTIPKFSAIVKKVIPRGTLSAFLIRTLIHVTVK